MKKILALFMAIILIMTFAACGENTTSSETGGDSSLPTSSDTTSETTSGTESESETQSTSSGQTTPVSYSGEYTRVVKYLNEDMKLVINGDTATFTTAKLNLNNIELAFTVDKEISIYKGNITIDENGYVVFTPKETFYQLELLGTVENINLERNFRLESNKKYYEEGGYTTEEYNRECEYAKGNPVLPKVYMECSWTFKLDNESRKLLIVKAFEHGYNSTYEYREDGTVKTEVWYNSDGYNGVTQYDKYGHRIKEGITLEHYPSGAIKSETYSDGYRDEYNEEGRLIKSSGGSMVRTVVYGSDYRVLKETFKNYAGGVIDFHMEKEWVSFYVIKSTTYHPATDTPQEIYYTVKTVQINVKNFMKTEISSAAQSMMKTTR